MRWLARLLRQKAGQTPSRVEGGKLVQFRPGDVVDAESLAAQHNEGERVIRSLQARLASVEAEMRTTVGRVDVLEGKPNSTDGDPIAIHMLRAGVE